MNCFPRDTQQRLSSRKLEIWLGFRLGNLSEICRDENNSVRRDESLNDDR